MLVAVPSKGRAFQTSTQKILPDAVFFVPESEAHQYSNIKNVVAVPSGIQGITKTRNWILKNTDEQRVVFLDDDVKRAGYIRLNETSSEHIKMHEQDFWLQEFEKCFDITEQLHYKIFGLKTESQLKSTFPFFPILLRCYVTASCMGIINDGEYLFDEAFPVKEDYELCLRHIREKKGILGIRYLYWENEHWDKPGGCNNYRTMQMERDAIKKLIQRYPENIKKVKRKANEFCIELNL